MLIKFNGFEFTTALNFWSNVIKIGFFYPILYIENNFKGI